MKLLLDRLDVDARRAFKNYQNLKDFFKEHKDGFIAAAAKDTGKPAIELEFNEWIGVTSAFTFLDKNLQTFLKVQEIDSSFPSAIGRRQIYQRRRALGNVLVLGTWNFPISLHLVQILFAVACGNKVFFKPSPNSKALYDYFANAIQGSVLVDQIKLIEPEDKTFVEDLKSHVYDHLLFTGGSSAGDFFAKLCAESGVPCTIEASGSELAWIGRNADLDESVEHLMWALFHYSGQTCVAPRFWWVHESQFNQTSAIINEKFRKYEEEFLKRPPLRTKDVEIEHQKWVDWATAQGAEFISSNLRPEFKLGKIRQPLDPASPQTFGPAAVLIAYKDENQILDWARKSPWSLMSTFMGEPSSNESAVLARLETKAICLGESVATAADAAVPFGGLRKSGQGEVHGLQGLLNMTYVQSYIGVKKLPGAKLLGAFPTMKSFEKLRSLEDVKNKISNTAVVSVFKDLKKNFLFKGENKNG